MMRLDTVEDVFIEQIADLQSAESQLLQALPKMERAATNEELRDGFRMHLEQTRQHAERLQRVAGMVGNVPAEQCEAMRGLIQEGEEVINAQSSNPDAKDAALIAAAQRVEHYEIAAYGTARTLADQLDMGDAASLLDETLDEEKQAHALLNKVATGGLFKTGINEKAAT